MKNLFAFFACLSLLATFPAAAGGAEVPEETEKIVVTATGAPVPAEQLGASVRVITAEEIARSGKRDVAEILSPVAGLEVSRTGSRGGSASLFARGGESDHNLVMINGVQINQTGGGFDFGQLSAENVERIEIVKGAHSSLYGSDAAASVINIITKKGAGAPAISASAALGYRSEKSLVQEYSASVSGGADAYGYFLSYGRTDDGGTLETNNRYRNDGFAGNFDLAPADGLELSFFSVYRSSNFGFPTGGAGDRFDAYADPDQGRKEKAATLGSELRFLPTGWWENFARFGYSRLDANNYDGPEPAGRDMPFPLKTLDARLSLEYGSTFTVDADSVSSATTAGVEYERESFRSGDLDRSRKNYAFYVQEHLGLFGKLFLTPGVRFDRNDSFGKKWSPSAFAALKIDRTGTKLRAGIGKGIKEPTFSENFGSSFSTPNPDLRPEETLNREIGVDQELAGGAGRIGVTLFHNRHKNLVAYSFEAFPNGTNFENISRTRARGAEVELSLLPGGGLAVDAAYTYLDTEVTDDGGLGSAAFAKGEKLLRRPVHSFSAGANYSRNALNLNVSGNYAGTRDDVDWSGFPGTRVENGPVFTADLAASWEISRSPRRLLLFTRVENLFDRDYERVFGFSSPGLSWVSGISAGVRPAR